MNLNFFRTKNISGFFPAFYGKLSVLAVIMFAMFSSAVFAEGTKQIWPRIAQPTHIQINNPSLTGFATFGSTADQRLNIHINNPVTEAIYYGFGKCFYGDQPAFNDTTAVSVQYRIRSPNGTIVFTGTIPTSGAGYIRSHPEALAGPQPIAGSSGYNPLFYQPDSAGDYYIEFKGTRKGVSPYDFHMEYTDITVANTVTLQAKDGRLWSKGWDLSVLYLSHAAYNSFYVYTPDSMVTQLYMNGMKPYGYTVMCNSTGVRKNGSIASMRQSSANKELYPEYKIFLNDPDHEAYPSGTPAQIIAPTVFGNCTGTAYCINVNVNKSCYADAYLELNGVSGYQVGSLDYKFDQYIVAGDNCFLWNGRDGLGGLVAPGTNVNFYLNLITGLTNFPIFDAEFNQNGLIISTIRPIGSNPVVYWDDTQIRGNLNLAGCASIGSLGCHAWDSGANDVPYRGAGYGNIRTINTWWSSYSQHTIASLTVPPCQLMRISSQTLNVYPGFPAVCVDPSTNNYDPGLVLDSVYTIVRGGNPARGFVTGGGTGSRQLCYTPNITTQTGFDTVVVRYCQRDNSAICYNDTTYIIITGLPAPRPVHNDVTATLGDVTPINVDPNDNNLPSGGMNSALTTIISGPGAGNGAAVMSGGILVYTPTRTPASLVTIYVWVYNSNRDRAMDTVYYHFRNDPPITHAQTETLSSTAVLTVNPNTNNSDPNFNLVPLNTTLVTPQTWQYAESVVVNQGIVYYTPRIPIVSTGTDAIYLWVYDSEGLRTMDTVYVVVPQYIYVQPVADQVQVQGGCPHSVTFFPNNNNGPLGFLGNPSQAPGTFGTPRKGTMTFNGDGSLTYTPACSSVGRDSVIVKVCATTAPNFGDCRYDTIFFTIVNNPPVAVINRETMTTIEGDTSRFNDNNSDPNGNLIRNRSVIITDRGLHKGTASIIFNGDAVRYVPRLTETGEDTVFIRIFDSGLPVYSAVDTVVFTIPQRQFITNINDYVTYEIGSSNAVRLRPLQNNSPFASQDPFSVVVIKTPRKGLASAVGGSPGEFTYVGSTNFITGVDTMVIRVSTTAIPALRSSVTDTIFINLHNSPPSVADTTVQLSDMTPVQIVPRITDINNNIVKSTLVQDSARHLAKGTVTVTNGIVTYRPVFRNGEFDTIYMRIRDNGLPFDTARYKIFIHSAVGPLARGKVNNYILNKRSTDSVFVFNPFDNNFPVISSVNLSTVKVTGQKGFKGTPSFNADATLNYKLLATKDGVDSVFISYYTNFAGTLTSIGRDTAVFNIINSAPVAKTTRFTLLNYDAVTINPNTDNSDINGNIDPKKVSIIKASNKQGLFTTVPANNSTRTDVKYTPAEGATGGIDTVVVQIEDNGSNPQAYQVNDTIIVTLPTAPRPVGKTALYYGDVNGPKITIDPLAYITSSLDVIDKVNIVVRKKPTSLMTSPTVGFDPVLSDSYKTWDFSPGQGKTGKDYALFEIFTNLPTPFTRSTIDTVWITLVNSAPITHKTIREVSATCTQPTTWTTTVDPNADNSDRNNNIDPTHHDLVRDANKYGVAQVEPSSGIVSYYPNAGQIGDDTLILRIYDLGMPVVSSLDTVIFRIINNEPVSTDQYIGTADFDGRKATVNGVKTVSDANCNIDTGCVAVTNGPFLGVISIDPNNGYITYTADKHRSGQDSITVKVCDKGQKTTEFKVYFTVPEPPPFSLEIPEGFSPNGDNVNDYFVITNLDELKTNLELTVYNLWGGKVYYSSKYKNDWDGKPTLGISLGDGPVPDGTYYYVADPHDGSKPMIRFITIKK